MFPPPYLDAVKLDLLNEPIYHGNLAQATVCKKLLKDGDFLIQDGDEAYTLLLSVFKNTIHDFLITIEQTKKGHHFVIGKLCFDSLEELTFKLKSVQSGLDTIRLEAAIYRTEDINRFGAHCFIDELPRTIMKTLIPLPSMKRKSALVMLRKAIVHEGIDDELESLMMLKHRNLIKLEDFVTYRNGPILLRYEMHRKTSLYEAMKNESDFCIGILLKWMEQAASLAFYLVKQECFNTILCAQDCYLDEGRNIKFRGAWNTSWPNWQADTFRHTYYWRFIAPEALFYEKYSSSSMIWNLGVFIWQISTSCALSPFFHCRSRQSYLDAFLTGGLSLMGNEKDIDSNELALLKNTAKLPTCIESTISQCVVLDPLERCLWSTILNITNRERTVVTIGSFTKKIFPFI